MSKRFYVVLPAFALIGLLASGAPAADDDYARAGWFVGAQGTYAVENIDGGSFDNSGGFNIRAGKRYGPKFAMELEYEWLDDFGDAGVDLNTWMLSANGRYYVAQGPIQPFLMLGLGLVVAETDPGSPSKDDSEAFGARFGGGLEMYVTSNVAVTTDITYVVPAGDLSDLQFATFSGGFVYRR